MYSVRSLFNTKTVIQTAKRNIGSSKGKRPYDWAGEGIKFKGFKYFPRHEGEVDPPYIPSKLFRVQRLKPLKGLPYWEKDILKKFRLDGKAGDVAILKNIPEINSMLWRVKHVVRITPITFPNGMPDDVNGTFLKENGELVVTKTISPVDVREDASHQFEKNPKKLDGDTMRRELRKRWLSGW